MDDQIYRVFGKARLDDRQVDELIGICRGALADGNINQLEAEYLQKWLASQEGVTSHPLISTLAQRVDQVLEDGFLDNQEAEDLLETLSRFVGGDFELGERAIATTLPVDDPCPEILVPERSFCFTGTFVYGDRKKCEKAIADRAGRAGSLTRKTDFLVVGGYATDSWIHSNYGRKVESAVQMKEKGLPIAIVTEDSWVAALS